MAIMARKFIKNCRFGRYYVMHSYNFFLADIMSCIRIISFWHTVCFLISVRSRRNSITGVEKQPDKKKSLNNNK